MTVLLVLLPLLVLELKVSWAQVEGQEVSDDLLRLLLSLLEVGDHLLLKCREG